MALVAQPRDTTLSTTSRALVTRPGETESKVVSSNPVHYKDFVLYVIPSDENSTMALRLAVRIEQRVLCRNVGELSQRPAWLKGVPTLVETRSGQVYTGSNAISRLEEAVQEPRTPSFNEKKAIGYSFDHAFEVDNLADNILFERLLPSTFQDKRYTLTDSITEGVVRQTAMAREKQISVAFEGQQAPDQQMIAGESRKLLTWQ